MTVRLPLVVGVAVLLGAGPALARPGGHGQMRGRRGLVMQAALVRAGLSPEQMERIRRIHFDARRRAIPLRARLQRARLDLQEAMGADAAPSEARVRALATKLARLHGELRALRLTARVRARRVMTVAQWRKVKRIRGEMMMRRMTRGVRGARRPGWRPPAKP